MYCICQRECTAGKGTSGESAIRNVLGGTSVKVTDMFQRVAASKQCIGSGQQCFDPRWTMGVPRFLIVQLELPAKHGNGSTDPCETATELPDGPLCHTATHLPPQCGRVDLR